MGTIAGFPYEEVQFKKEGGRYAPENLQPLMDRVAASAITDLIVFSHGWNNDMDEARELYAAYFAQAQKLLGDQTVMLAGQKLGVLGVLWPSKKFADEDLIPSGAASLQDGNPASLRRSIQILRELLQDAAAATQLNRAETLLPKLCKDASARSEFVGCLQRVLPADSPEAREDGADELLHLAGETLLDRLRPVAAPVVSDFGGGAASVRGNDGGATGIGDLVNSVTAAAQQLLNYTTYYVMKERAGSVGKIGLAPTLAELSGALPELRFHLVGHSFGGRLVTAAAEALNPGATTPLRSLLLLQAAFSHFGFAKDLGGGRSGFFRDVIVRKKIAGPVAVTHTRNDKVVGLAYAIASRVAGDDANAIGDANDRYGGIGSNGALKTPEHVEGKLANAKFQFASGYVYNLGADDFIHSHSDICNSATARVLLEVIAAAAPPT